MRPIYQAAHALKRRSRVAHGLMRRAALLVPDRTVERDVPLAGRLAFGLRRQRWLLHERCLDGHRVTLGLYQRLVRPGDVLYDVGGNIGLYARLALALFGCSRVVAFEPMGDNLKLLRRNAELADAPLDVHALALGDRDDAAVTLQVDDVADGSAVLDTVSGGTPSHARAAKGLGPKTETVRLARLDTLLPTLPAPPDVIKIDVEGAEALMLAGSAGTLREHRPKIILATHGPTVAAEAIGLLDDAGYHVGGWLTDAWRGGLTRADATALRDNNLIASPDPADVETEPPLHDLQPRPEH